jgi:hypothetical protein
VTRKLSVFVTAFFVRRFNGIKEVTENAGQTRWFKGELVECQCQLIYKFSDEF